MSHKIRKSLPENPPRGGGGRTGEQRQKESKRRLDRRRGVREEEIIWFWSRRIVTAVRRVEPCLRFAQISAKISPIVDGGGAELWEKRRTGTGKNRTGGREVAKARRETAA